LPVAQVLGQRFVRSAVRQRVCGRHTFVGESAL
jgi:hypothetical protein